VGAAHPKRKKQQSQKMKGKRFPIIKSTRAGVSTGKCEREREKARKRARNGAARERRHASCVVSWVKKFPVFLEHHKKVVDINIIIEVAKI